MKLITLCILLLFIVPPSFGQSKEVAYKLVIDFAPSFISSSTFELHGAKDESSIRLKVTNASTSQAQAIEEVKTMTSQHITPLVNFLKTYRFRTKSNIDTTGSHKAFENGDSVTFYHISLGTDGITVSGSLTEISSVRKFAFWSPNKGTENARFMTLLFSLMKTFKSESTVNYVEQLEQYFPHGLGLRKLSDKPLTYKLYGSISSDEADELEAFLCTLPKNRKVLIDVSNLIGMGTMFYDVFEEFCAKRTNLNWLRPSSIALVDLYKSGIPNKYIISKKKIIRIKLKDGQEVIESVGN